MSVAPGPRAPGADSADPRIARHAWIVLVFAAVAAGGTYLLQYHRHNAAPPVDLASFPHGPHAGFAFGMERCYWTPRKIVVEGWIARRGVGAGRRLVRAVVVDRAGRGFAMKTSMRDREDVSARLNQRFGDRVRYRNAGFTASVSVATAGLAPDRDQVALLYDDGDTRARFPLPCGPGSGA